MNLTEAKKLLDGKNLAEARSELCEALEDFVNGTISQRELSKKTKLNGKMTRAAKLLMKDAASRGEEKSLEWLFKE